MTNFDPQQVTITFNFRLNQIDLIIEGLGKLPIERAGDLYNGIKAGALQTLQAAEKQAQIDNQQPPPAVPAPPHAPLRTRGRPRKAQSDVVAEDAT